MTANPAGHRCGRLALLAGCSDQALWQEWGYDSETEYWQDHGWGGSVSDGVDCKAVFNYWCG